MVRIKTTKPGEKAIPVGNANAELLDMCQKMRNERQIETSSARRTCSHEAAPQRKRLRWVCLLNPFWLIRRLWALVLKLIPGRVKQSKGARLARRQPGLFAWFLIFGGAGLVIAAQDFSTPRLHSEPVRYQRWLQSKGTGAVEAALLQIGPGVKVDSIRARPYKPWMNQMALSRP